IDEDLSRNIYSTGFYAVKPKDGLITKKCLFYLINSSLFLDEKDKNCSGATQKAINNQGLSNIELNIPEFSMQESLTQKLDALSIIIEAKQSQIEYLDNLIKARFVEMFKGKYDSFKVGEKLKTTSGGTPKSSVSEYYDGGDIPWLTSGEVNYGDITKPSNYITEKGLNNSSAKWIPENSIVIAMYGATAGKVGIVRYKTTTNQAVCSVLPNDNFNQEFLRYAFQDISEELTSKAIGGGQPNISQTIIKNSYIVDAPIEEQERFASFAKQVDKSKFAITQSLLYLTKTISDSFIPHSGQISVLLSSRDSAG
ncbi:MAG: restriction endonuclease subunit S, partial [Candidatus Saccharibacteria bacterium]|nr:restriction endonuclease subunit S [Candidatus Saccharibacteria bacterium]